MKIFSMVVFVAIIFLQGCASLRPVTALPEGETVKENVTILRNYNYVAAAIHYWPTVDGVDVAGLLVQEHISFRLSPGRHQLGVHCFGGWWPRWLHDQIEVDIQEGLPRFFLLSPYGISCAEIEEIQESEALDRLKKSTRIKTGHVSNCARQSVLYENAEDVSCSSTVWP